MLRRESTAVRSGRSTRRRIGWHGRFLDGVTAQGVKLLLIGMEIGRQRDGSGRDESAATQNTRG